MSLMAFLASCMSKGSYSLGSEGSYMGSLVLNNNLDPPKKGPLVGGIGYIRDEKLPRKI